MIPLISNAIDRALGYLYQHQYPNGEFCSYFAPDAPMREWCVPDSVVFPTTLIASCLLHASATDNRVEAMLDKSVGFLRYQMTRGGLWRHFTHLHRWYNLCPPDIDDTCCVSAVLRARGINLGPDDNHRLLLANRNRTGLFYSWFLLRLRWQSNRTYWRVTLPELLRPIQSLLFWHSVEASRNDVDGVVNANTLYYLGDIEETQPVIAFMLRIIAEGREADCDLWYRDAHAVYYFFSRCYHAGIRQLEPLRQPVIERIMAAAQPNGCLGQSVLDTAWAVCALLNLGVQPTTFEPAIQFLLASQRPNGEWPRWLAYYGGPKKLVGWGSEEVTTAFCLEALARYHHATSEGCVVFLPEKAANR